MTRNRPARTITLSQSFYIGQDLEKFEMAQAKPVSTPLPFGHQLAPPTSPSSSSHPYAELIGLLMYAMMCTCADLAYPISVLARFVGTSRHTTEHWQATKRVLRYLRRTKDHVLTLGGPFPPLLLAFRDSSWADSQPNRRSSQCCGFTLGSGLVSWRSTSSSAIALSFCEAELYAGIMAAQESRWLCFLLAELGAPQHCPTLWCDNASTIHLTQDPVYHARSKHIVLDCSAADSSAVIPPPLISPLSGAAAYYSTVIPPLISPLSGAAADYSAVIPPLIYPLNGSAADYLAPIPLPLIFPLNCSAADYLAPIPPPLISPLNSLAADYLGLIPPPLISPLNASAADYLAPISPPLISPLNGSAADYLAPIPPPPLSPHIFSIAIPSP
ncbi:unnamed protein product [Closterium sp. NIES-54]